jgi:hypothetical protein
MDLQNRKETGGGITMDVREKLVETLRKPIFPHELVDPIEAVADYLLDSGITVLPCNVGDKIYYIDRYTGKLDEDTVKFLTITKSGAKPILKRHNIKFWDFYKWGKSVFANRAEAESALVNR